MAPLTMADTQNGYFITCFQISHRADTSLAVGSELCALCISYEKNNNFFYYTIFLIYFIFYYIFAILITKANYTEYKRCGKNLSCFP